MMVEGFVEISKRKVLKVKAGKSKVVVLGGEEESLYDVCVG